MENNIKHISESDIVMAENTIPQFYKYVCRRIPTYEGRMPAIVESYPEHDGTVNIDMDISDEEFDFIDENVYEADASMSDEDAYYAIGIRFVYDDGDNFYYFK